MPSSIFYNGKIISIPGSYSQVDASGLDRVGVSASGIVGVIGQAEGGKPVSAITETKDFIRVNTPDKAKKVFRSGDLREVAAMLFDPSKDADIQGGAQELVCMKVNPATQSAVVLPNAYGNSLDIVSKDYGAFTEQLNVQVATGTVQGKRFTSIFEDTTEAGDNIGGDAQFKLKYTKPTGGWDTMLAQIIAGGEIKASATRAMLGLDSQITGPLAAPGAVEVVSASAGDVGQKVTVYGIDGTGAAKREVLTLNGLTAVAGAQIFAAGKVLGAELTGTTVGIVTIRPAGGGTTIAQLAAGANTVIGLARGVCMYAAGVVTAVADAATTKSLIVVGLNSSGAVALEKLTLNGTTPVVGTAVWSEIKAVVLGEVEIARTATLSGVAAWAKAAVQKNLLKAADYFNARSITGTGGFTFTLVTPRTSTVLGALDVTIAATSCVSPTEPSFYADLFALKEWINANSQFIAASISSGATGGAPSNTSAPIFLSGGTEGTSLFSHWQTALNLLKKTRVNTVVVLTADPAVHAALDAHCAYMNGVGRSERDGVVGILNAAMTDLATKDETKAQIIALNSRNIRVVSQAMERFNSEGERQEFSPAFHAAVVAGMQAGASVGLPLTHKYANVLALRQSNTWNPVDDAEEMIQAGLLFLETVEGVGQRVVRNITTHLSSNNLAFTEASVNQAVNFAVYDFRTGMEFIVGKKGFAGSVNAAKGVAINLLGLQIANEVITTYNGPDIELVADTLEVTTEIAPVIPINFVKNTIHLVATRQTA